MKIILIKLIAFVFILSSVMNIHAEENTPTVGSTEEKTITSVEDKNSLVNDVELDEKVKETLHNSQFCVLDVRPV